MADGSQVLEKFTPAVRTWFRDVFDSPTTVQVEAWNAVSQGANTLLVAPTGSGKTLAAFLWALNELVAKPAQQVLRDPSTPAQPLPADAPGAGVKVLYISPLKALGVDVEHNLRAPLVGITHTAVRLGQPAPNISVGVRSGDTPAKERTRQVKYPPDILITTPESLYLMLTSKAAASLAGVTTVIIDEIHAVAASKRGVHLALSLERLELLVGKPIQRIGLSATVQPLEAVAGFLTGDREVTIIAPPAHKQWDVAVRVPVADMADLPTPEPASTIGNAVVDDQLTEVAGSNPGDLQHHLALQRQQPSADPDDHPAHTVEDAGNAPHRSDADASFDTAPDVPLHPRALQPATDQPQTNLSDLFTFPNAEPSAGDATDAAAEPAETADSDVTPLGELLHQQLANFTTFPPTGAATFGNTVPHAGEHALTSAATATSAGGSIWPFIEESIFAEIMEQRSTLIFVNSRRTAERLTSRINEIYAQHYDPASLHLPGRRPPAQVMVAADEIGKAPTVIARAHHGSVSKDERAEIEAQLKAGELRCVVATSSLELGIDMGAVDLVIQVEAPPSVAAALQRVGRAGHTVGAVSRGSVYPKHRADLVATTVTVERMLRGDIEAIHIPTNALDVLCQQTVAAASLGPLDIDQWYGVVCRAYPYRTLAREVFDACIELVTGQYPSTDFRQLRPRLIHDETTNQLIPRPGAQRLAVTSGGTIPDRGMFGVFLLGTGESGRQPRRVGELDEEMVYESRVGDVFTLGASSWRIEDITKDQVIVTPAPGHTGRLPFWSGEQASRPYELGCAVGALRREVATDPQRLAATPLDSWAKENLTRFISEQQDACGMVPDEQTLLFERFRDEVGDWRIVFHTPFGRGVNAAWALLVGQQISETTGMEAWPQAADDGIVLRLPDSAEPPSAELFVLDPETIADAITELVGSSALFASRFRECAARALLLPKKNPGARAPLWQQRQRAAQLLDVARKYPTFPIILETVRECVHDVYDVDSLVAVQQQLAQRAIRIVEVTVEQPSPFAASLLFNYTGAFMYEGDSPLAERRAAALALDPTLLAKLLGKNQLAQLLDEQIIDEIDAQLRRKSPDRRARTPEEFADTLRLVGPVQLDDLPQMVSFRATETSAADGLVATPANPHAASISSDPELDTAAAGTDHADFDQSNREDTAQRLATVLTTTLGSRVMRVRIGGRWYLAQSADAPLLRDGLGVPVPPGVPCQQAIIPDALQQLLRRFAQTRGPFTLADVTASFGLAPAAAHTVLAGLVAAGDLLQMQVRQSQTAEEYIAPQVLQLIRKRCLAHARAQIEPVSQAAYTRFLLGWHGIEDINQQPTGVGVDGVFAVIEQLAGVRIPASCWETWIFPSRVVDYDPAMLDELTRAGEVLVVGCAMAAAKDPWIMLLPVDYAAQLITEPDWEGLTDRQLAIVSVLASGGGFYFPAIQQALEQGVVVDHRTIGAPASSSVGDEPVDLDALVAVPYPVDDASLRDDLWVLIGRGIVTIDGFAPLRAHLAGATGAAAAHRAKRTPARSRLRMGRTRFSQLSQTRRTTTPPDAVGRFALTPAADPDPTARSVAHGEAWLDRYGVVTRGSVTAEEVTGGFALAYKVLDRFEAAGKAMRGMFIDSLGAAQFSTPAIIDRLRAAGDSPDVAGWPSGATNPVVCVLAASDPANPYGAALPWPETAHRPNRAAGAIVVIADGLLAAHLTRGGKTLTLFPDQLPITPAATATLVVEALVTAVHKGHMKKFAVEKVGEHSALSSPLLDALQAGGATLHPKGVIIGGSRGHTSTADHSTGPRRGIRATTVLHTSDTDPSLATDPRLDPNSRYIPPGGGYRRGRNGPNRR
ncbi:DEAD/DEAH box helicase [Corynebacterium choanae]|uniref:Putative ATP-dependent helicase Lhr n=1 Tax=Corynebacterium choanae TaxID=1862358 RepID=A0A3G6JAQ6_9CORY|nr:crosslink repair DNA glycosylase YcaQ family protein [Corynebacterium choanae]AZA13054.1 putative ATP-dependent helicase Lhr [Corynebacterium choanae]